MELNLPSNLTIGRHEMVDATFSRYRQYYQRLQPVLKKPHIRAYTMAALSFLALSFFGAFAIRPAIKQIVELNRKIDDRRLVTKKLDEKIKKLQAAEIEYEKVQSDLPIVLAALPQEPNFPPFLKNLEGTASDSAVLVTDLKFRDIALFEKGEKKSATSSAGLTSPDSLPFDLGASGSYPALSSLLQRIERGTRLVNIGEVNLGSEEEGTSSAELRISLKALAYFFPNKIGGGSNE